MNIHMSKRLFLAAAVLGTLAVFAAAFFVALGLRSVVAGPDAAPAAQLPNPGHSYDQVELPAGTWPGLDADLLDGLDSGAFSLGPHTTSLPWSSITSRPAGLDDGDDDILGGLSCANGEIAKWDGLAWQCGADVDTDTQLSEGQVETFVTNGPLDLDAATTLGGASISTGPHTTSLPWTSITTKPAGFADDIDDDILGGLSCANGEIAKWDGSAWQCGADVDTDTQLSEGQVETFVTNGPLDLDAATTLGGASISTGPHTTSLPWTSITTKPAGFADDIDDDILGGLSCANGEIAKWDGLAWQCGADVDTDTQLSEGQVETYVTDGPLDLDAATTLGGASISTGPHTTSLPWSSITTKPAGFADDTDDDTTYTAGTGLSLAATEFGMATTYRLPQSCGNGQIAEWNGSVWVCGDDDTGGGTFWALAGNAGTTPGTDFVGTTDNQALELHVNSSRALRLEPDATSPNVIGGYSGNWLTGGVYGATISGGGESGNTNRVTDNYGTIGGGRANQAGDNDGTTNQPYATIGGGWDNIASGWSATVSGGKSNAATTNGATVAGGGANMADAGYATVSGGAYNKVTDSGGTIGGGWNNQAGDNAGMTNDMPYATVGGGYSNTASNEYATVSGGYSNTASSPHATVGGGDGNTARDYAATVGGGYDNTAAGEYATVGGGTENGAVGFSATVGGGLFNVASGDYATISGGTYNTAISSFSATVGGGDYNTVSGSYATVGGGRGNTASAQYATVGGGDGNTASIPDATVGGGRDNTASGFYATVPGGFANTAQGYYSFAAGRRAKANNQGCFVWADSTDADFTCSTNDRFQVRAGGGLEFYSASDLSDWVKIYDDATDLITTSTGAHLTVGGVWTDSSDRELKENFSPVEGQEVLATLAEMPITTWNHKAEDPSIRHMGPVAQDFYAAFGLGEDDLHIASLDTSGVALAAIQGLYELSQEQAERIDALEARMAALEGGAAASNGSSGPLAASFTMGGLLLAGLVVGGLVVVQRRRAGGRS